METGDRSLNKGPAKLPFKEGSIKRAFWNWTIDCYVCICTRINIMYVLIMKYVCTMYLCVCLYVYFYICTYIRTYVCAQCSEHFAVCRLLCVSLCRSSVPLSTHTHSSPLVLSLLCVRAALLQVCFHRYVFLIFLAFSLDVQRFF
jgi:hypothetical protein